MFLLQCYYLKSYMIKFNENVLASFCYNRLKFLECEKHLLYLFKKNMKKMVMFMLIF